MDNTTTLQKRTGNDVERLVALTVGGVDSPHTRRNYERAIRDFVAWWSGQTNRTLNLETMIHYRAYMDEQGMKAGNINARLSAIRRMIKLAAGMGLITDAERVGALQVPSKKASKSGAGVWLSREEAIQFLAHLPADTLSEIRDRALVALAIGSGLRRSELSALTVEHIVKHEGRWTIWNIIGKRNKSRNVPIAAWCKAAVDEWLEAAGITSGPVFRRILKSGKLATLPTNPTLAGIHPQSIMESLQRAIERARANGAELPAGLACHDLRRTFAQLARKGGAPIEQIAHSLGHDSIATTERYLGINQDFEKAPSDFLGITLTASRGMHAGRAMYL
jgi:site-specific recombinase XerD